MYGSFEDFPPMLIQVGGDEMLLSDSISVAEKAKQAGSRVKLSVYDGMFHVFQMAMKLMPESVRAWNEAGRFLSLIMRRKSTDTFRLALVERNIIWEDKAENLKAVGEIVGLLKDRDIDLIALPEMSLTGFSMNTEITAEQEEKSGDEHNKEVFNTVSGIKKLAAESGINIGVGWVKKPENEGDRRCENHYTIISPGKETLLDYVKLHPFSYAGEDKYFKGGDKLDVCGIEGVNIGTVICYDLRFAESFIKLADKAELILVPANWPAARSLHWSTLLRARAIENQCYMAGVNCCGEMNGQAYSGDSGVFGPEGEMLTPVDTITINETDKIYIYDIVNNVQEVRDKFPVRQDRRKDVEHLDL
jgi:predicted amidohydrolase